MQVICTDGTMFSCEGYELTEYGVMCYAQPRDPEGERYDSDPEQVAYVPHDRLWYVLPNGVSPNVAIGGTAGQAVGGQPLKDQTGQSAAPPTAAEQSPGSAVGGQTPGQPPGQSGRGESRRDEPR